MKHCHFSILYNEIDFLRLKLPFLYEHFDQIIFYDLNAFGPERTFSTDGSHEFIKNYPDPEEKITLIEQTDLTDVTPLGHSNIIKQKMFSLGSTFVRDDIDIFWCTDMDEFFSEDLIKEAEEKFKHRGCVSLYTKLYTFYKYTDFITVSNKSIDGVGGAVRICRHTPGNKYGHCNLGDVYKPSYMNIKNYLYHLSWLGQKRVDEKFSYYKDNQITTNVSARYIKEWEAFTPEKYETLKDKRGFYGNPFVGPGRFERTQVVRAPFDLYEQLPYLDKSYINSMINGETIKRQWLSPKPIAENRIRKSIDLIKNKINQRKTIQEKSPKSLSSNEEIVNAGSKKINVIISAYEAQNFIEECLDSIQNQTYPAHKILLGIDGCIKTLEKVREIRHKYTNLNVYYSENNTGPYQVFNALMELVPDDEYIQRFDADDIMNPNMLEEMSKYDVPAVSRHDGVLFIKKEIINQLGGFRNWRCAADSDMVTRISILFNKKDITRTLKYFILRQHDKQLTKHSDTNLNSDLRKQYTEIINKNKNSKKPDIYIKPIFSDLKKLKNYMDYNFVLSKKTISVNLSTYPARKTSLIKSLNNLLTIDTIDIIRVYLNEYKKIPDDFPKNDKILYFIGKQNLKDSGKFYWAEDLKNEYYFTIDDDLIYPDQYFIEHIKLLDQYKGNIFVSLHGKVMRPNPINFNDVSEFYHCLAKVKNDVWVNNGGTGVMVFDNSKFTIPISIFKFHGMTDLWIAYYCQQNKIPILCRKHEETELKYLLDKEETLFDQRKQLDVYHQKVLKMIKTWNLYKL